ncbi:amino acid ABC transporter permease [Rhizobium anhuiense]|nr:amino acid ABC transporter permease [Rhizobium anhuiense]
MVRPFLPLILQGTLVTLTVGFCALFGAVIVGLLGLWGSSSESRLANRVVLYYTTIVRGIPDLVLMLLLYYGGQTFLNQIGDSTGLWGYIEISTFAAGVGTISFIFGAYMTETFRGAALSIPRGQIEAGLACGLSQHRLFTRIIWPQLLRYALPGIGNNWQVLMKTTALVSVIGLQDLVFNSFQAGRSTHHMFMFMGLTFIVYLLITIISGILIRVLENRYGLQVAATAE